MYRVFILLRHFCLTWGRTQKMWKSDPDYTKKFNKQRLCVTIVKIAWQESGKWKLHQTRYCILSISPLSSLVFFGGLWPDPVWWIRPEWSSLPLPIISPCTVYLVAFLAVFRIRNRIRIHRIHMFLGLPDPDSLVRGMDPGPAPDPSVIKQK